jgi:hypothetical protein
MTIEQQERTPQGMARFVTQSRQSRFEICNRAVVLLVTMTDDLMLLDQ